MSTTQRTDEQRRILEQVATGELSPEEAARLMESLTPQQTQPPSQDYSEEITGVRVVTTFKTVRIQGDPSVSGAVAQGEHRVRTQDGKMIFEEEENSEQPGYVLFGPRNRRFRFAGTINGKKIQIGEGPDIPPVLDIRMNPSLPLEIEMTAGTVNVNGVEAEITATITAGSGMFGGVRSPIKASVDAGSLNIQGVFDRGESNIRCTAGKVSVGLEPGSDVKIRARATLGKVSLPGGQSG
ncbi:MAG TPA: hypothetical protein VNA87_06325, partial [Actinomycetota bacterium]|nr:hypothetical protein [Actinomycetota bacterium]